MGLISFKRKWQPTPVFLPGKFPGLRNLAVCSPWAFKNYAIEWLSTGHIEKEKKKKRKDAAQEKIAGRCHLLKALSSVKSFSHVQLFAIPWTAARQASLSITNSQRLLKLMSIEPMMPSSHFILCHSPFLLPSIFPSIRVFSNESALHIRWPQYWSFSFSISPSNEYSVLISFRMDCFHLLSVQGTLKNLLQHQSKSMYSLSLTFLYSPTLSSIHDYWKSHNFDYIDVCWQSWINGQYPKHSPAPPVARAWRWWVWWSWECWWLTVQVVAAGDFESLAEANLFGTFSQQWACGIVNSLRQFQGWCWPG